MLSYRLSEGGNFYDYDPDGRLRLSTARLRIWPPYEVARGAWNESSETVNLFIAPRFCEMVLGHPLVSGKIYYHAEFTRHDQIIETLLRVLLIDSLTGNPSGPTLGDGIVSAIVHRLDEASGFVSIPTSVLTYNDNQVRRAKAFIEANLASKMTLDRLADVAGLSTRHLCRAFKSATGSTPSHYILLRRIEEAKALILEGHLSLYEIAVQTGFGHHRHLSTAFHNALGQTPSQFRNSLR
ncbi:AraC family transcriptional regulator [Methylobacterium sp. E-065]|uniref:helix-turn-helix domain-containing protein n=1 Tax=Methylobacterium sp. E-065 TaxID=2836583 RepID=UPI001FB9CC16|nr:AraC family transcriptional regulator [Methylobacterium sp. E-065]MCJ2015918.1 AraC family transcriptional regulator [Methylobacterium sp. E-065]